MAGKKKSDSNKGSQTTEKGTTSRKCRASKLLCREKLVTRIEKVGKKKPNDYDEGRAGESRIGP